MIILIIKIQIINRQVRTAYEFLRYAISTLHYIALGIQHMASTLLYLLLKLQ